MSKTQRKSISRLQHDTDFDAEIVDSRDGFISLAFKGTRARKLFASEAGGHRWQRVPPTEHKGRVHTSTITVAVIDENEQTTPLDLRDVTFHTSRGSGPGGQHRNMTESCVTAVHVPSGLRARIDLRSQHESKELAVRVLAAKVAALQKGVVDNQKNLLRASQIGSGERGDKIRTYRVKDNIITDHRTGARQQLDKWVQGIW